MGVSESMPKKKNIEQVDGKERRQDIKSLDDIMSFDRFKVSASSAEDYREQLRNMYPVDLQKHAMENYHIIPYSVQAKKDRNRLIETCVKEFAKKMRKPATASKTVRRSKQSEKLAANLIRRITQ